MLKKKRPYRMWTIILSLSALMLCFFINKGDSVKSKKETMKLGKSTKLKTGKAVKLTKEKISKEAVYIESDPLWGEMSADEINKETVSNWIVLSHAYHEENRNEILEESMQMLLERGVEAVPYLLEALQESRVESFSVRSSIIIALGELGRELVLGDDPTNRWAITQVFNSLSDELKLPDEINVQLASSISEEDVEKLLHDGNYFEKNGEIKMATLANKVVAIESLRRVGNDESLDLVNQFIQDVDDKSSL